MLSPDCSIRMRCLLTTVLPNVLPQEVFIDPKPGCCLQQLCMQTKGAVADTIFCIIAALVTDCALVPCMSHYMEAVLAVALVCQTVHKSDETSVSLVSQGGP